MQAINKIISLQQPSIVKPKILTYLCQKVNPKIIVEIGTQRHGKASSEDGRSTVTLEKFGSEIHSVDISQKAINEAKAACQEKVEFHLQDGADFLSKFPKHIDFLYLDGGDDPEETYEQFKAAKVTLKSTIVIDDCMNYKGNAFGKGTKIIESGIKPFLTNHFGRYRMAIIRSQHAS